MAQEASSCPKCNSSLVVFSKKKRYICEDCGHDFVIQEKIVDVPPPTDRFIS